MEYISRAEWGASPNPNRADGDFVKMRADLTEGIVVHHSGVQNGPKGVKAVQAFERYHLSKGWDGIAYNWLVDEEGVIYEGRGWENRGAGTKGWNMKSFSVCYTGWGFSEVPKASLDSLIEIAEEAEGVCNKDLWVSTHRLKGTSTCPGDWLGDWVESGMNHLKEPEMPNWSEIFQYLIDLREQVKVSVLSLSKKSRGAAVEIVQTLLRDRGYDPGPIDGIFGRGTDGAVKEFQMANKTAGTADGIVGVKTWDALTTIQAFM